MKKFVLITAVTALTFAFQPLKAAVVAQYDFEDGVTFGTSTDSDGTSTASTFTAGAGIVGFGASTVGDTTAVPFTTSAGTGDSNASPDGTNFTGSSANQTTEAGAVTANDYLSFTLTPDIGVTYNFSQLDFKVALVSANPGPEGFFVRSSATGTTDLTSGTISNVVTADGAFQAVSIDLTGVAALQNVSTATEFRIYFYNPDNITSTTGDRVDKVQLQATIIPEPATWMLMGVGLLFGVQRLRRKA